MTVQGGGGSCATHGLHAVVQKESAASVSLPTRMRASWFAPQSALPSHRHRNRIESAVVLAAGKAAPTMAERLSGLRQRSGQLEQKNR
jgi:hypothetical protein